MPKLSQRRGFACLAGTILIAAWLGIAATARWVGAAEPLRRLPTPKHMTAESVAEFRARMGRHGNVMSNLVRAVVLIDRPTIRTLAGRIGDEEIVARVGATAGPAGRYPLPQDFFDQQDILRASAQQLVVAAAAEGDDGVLADHFATLARTCVTCHSVYLRHDPASLPAGAKIRPSR